MVQLPLKAMTNFFMEMKIFISLKQNILSEKMSKTLSATKISLTGPEAAAIPKFGKVKKVYSGEAEISRFGRKEKSGFKLNVESQYDTKLTFDVSGSSILDLNGSDTHYLITLIPTFLSAGSELETFKIAAYLEKLIPYEMRRVIDLNLSIDTTLAIIIEQKEPSPSMKKIFSLAVQEIIHGTVDRLVIESPPSDTKHLLTKAVIDLLYLKNGIERNTTLLRTETTSTRELRDGVNTGSEGGNFTLNSSTLNSGSRLG
jgi:hypothetical protein